MNLFFRFFVKVFVLILMYIPSAWSLNVMGLYTAACRRDLGIIINVDDHGIDFLTIKGRVKKIRSHEIIYLAYYPLDQFPMSGPADVQSVDQVKLKTKMAGELQPLLSGWPIGFAKDKISFLTARGGETIVSRRNIYEVEYLRKLKPVKFRKSSNPKKYKFIHPYIFRECPNKAQVRKPKVMYPQQVLNNPVMIKRELDVLKAGYKKVQRYHREQSFYPVPEVYKNETTLGIWHNFGSRYGQSSKRPSNLTPVLTDSYSSDIFDYQHKFITGSAPVMTSAHEESQTQAYYRFKASYFHFSAMFDPNQILVGRNYGWHVDDFVGHDDKLVSTSQIEMGFDFGRWAFELYLANSYNVGILANDNLVSEFISIPMFGVMYRNLLFDVHVLVGSGDTSEDDAINQDNILKMSQFRVNFTSYYFSKFRIAYSLISRSLLYNNVAYDYDSNALTNAFYGTYIYKEKYHIGGMASYEMHDKSISGIGALPSEKSNYFKFGAFISLAF